MTKTEIQHIPYKGVAQALNDLLGGQVPIAFASVPSVLQHIKAGKLVALGVSSAKRSPVLPDIPSIAEKIPGFSGTLWIGLFSPAGAPRAALTQLEAHVAQVLASNWPPQRPPHSPISCATTSQPGRKLLRLQVRE